MIKAVGEWKLAGSRFLLEKMTLGGGPHHSQTLLFPIEPSCPKMPPMLGMAGAFTPLINSRNGLQCLELELKNP